MIRAVVAALAALGLLLVIVSATPFVAWYGGKLAGPWNDPTGEILIVLGGSELTPGLIGESTYWRAIYALRAWRGNGFRRIVLCGAGVAAEMRNFLVSQGVPAQAITLETESHSTRENAVNAARLLAGAPGRKVLLTSDYHMFRAVRAFRRVGLAIEPRPFPDARKRGSRVAGRWPAFLDEALETGKIVYYFFHRWL